MCFKQYHMVRRYNTRKKIYEDINHERKWAKFLALSIIIIILVIVVIVLI